MEDGSKSIERVGRILRALESGAVEGMTIGEIAVAIDTDRTTVRRAIVSLERIGLVDREPQSRAYRLGTYLFSLGAKTARRFDVLSHAREAVRTLAERCGDTVFLVVRNKFDAVCIDRRSGHYPLKAQTLSIGDVLPLGVSSGGLAILATMSDADVKRVIKYNAVKINQFHSVKPQELYAHVQKTRKAGYSLYRGHIVAGMGALGFAIRDARGEALAALSVSAVIDRLDDERIKSLVAVFQQAVGEIETRGALISHGDFGRS